ncbi:ATP-binding cassette domain-containing protein [Candidatus Mycoplasma pogonae]
MKILFDLKNVTKKIKTKNIIDNINLIIYQKDKICLIGENGAGKSTLLNLITKVFLPSSGSIYTDEAIFENQQINYLTQENKFLINFKVKTLINKIKKNTENLEFFNYLYEVLNIDDIIDSRLFQLSGGEKQKLKFFQVLITEPKILILDEYSNHIDYPTSQLIKKIIQNYIFENEITLLIASHKLEEMENTCQKIILINEGKIMNVWEKSSVFDKAAITKIKNNFKKEA